mgnify:CR=1 FL=1
MQRGQLGAGVGVGVGEEAGEGRVEMVGGQGDFGGAHAGAGGVEVGLGLQHLGRRAEALLGQLLVLLLGQLVRLE